MPTNDTDNSASSTVTDANATQELDISTIPNDKLDSHPYVLELKKKASAAHQGMDSANLSKKELKAEVIRLKAIAGEEITDELQDENSRSVTKADLQQTVWELTNAKDVDLYGDDKYKTDIEKGIPKDYALENAKLRYQTNPDNARLERRQAMGQGSAAGDRNIVSEDLTGFDPIEAAKWGYSKESFIKQKQNKKARGQI